MTPVQPMVKLRGVSRQYGAEAPVVALRGIDLDVYPGETVAVVGASGSGKSTLLNIVGCLDRQSSGSYSLDGIDVAGLSDRQRAGLRSQHFGFIFQSFHLLSYRSVLENVMLAEVYRRRSRVGRAARARTALAAVGLDGRHDFLPTKLSGGERQRVAIARALLNEPELLLCDEPTGNLDSATTTSILELLGALRNERRTIVMITHDTGVAQWADRRVRIADGVIVGEA
ncbi:MAG TPA: ABC transporter ATP-binding protein [Nocardioidaceae bacterium]|nr:ABC transporter ATP-binding protein [Nocardioidaceae bacterium]